MTLLSSLINFLKKDRARQEGQAPEGLCPNCWGRTEYAGKFFEAVKINNFDIDHPNANTGWIKDYADKHLSEIELKYEDNLLVCKKCKVTYRPT